MTATKVRGIEEAIEFLTKYELEVRSLVQVEKDELALKIRNLYYIYVASHEDEGVGKKLVENVQKLQEREKWKM